MGVQISPRAPRRKLQASGVRLAEFIPTQEGLGGQNVLHFGLKNELEVLHSGKRKFFNHKVENYY